MSDLCDLVERVRAGGDAGAAMVEEFRRTAVLVPRDRAGRLAAADAGGIRWVFAFTAPAELARWALARGGDGGTGQDYVTILGRRLLTVAPAAAGRPAGVALDVAGGRPMLLPPMRGIVPDDFALDA
ncbi:SseB family protein [Amycolatopsis australiensis]|uniref:SseB protein N-terminal domain-containing protein n=1 Tax=Amycolatopsis australiensis TaxID=546364 RepID=A0A1K1PG90_9PSEU|nr:SseB family protein [Amycolatopsis australiensis]SFW46596.1 SseB protein N-terminal domain-containing protein [Amycolatopsis australiensis]